MSGEHLFDDWLNRLFAFSKAQPVKMTRYEVNQETKERMTIDSWTTNNLSATAKVACEPCNNGWMSELTEHLSHSTFREMLAAGAKDATFSLTSDDLVALTAMTFLKAVVADHMQALRPSFFVPAVRHRFAIDFTLPDGLQAWIGRFIRPGHRVGFFNAQYFTLRNGASRGFEFYVFTYVISPVALQVAVPRWTKLGKRRPSLPRLRQHTLWAEGSIEIWPQPNVPVTWPPPKIIGDDTIQAFMGRWGRLQESVGQFP